MNADLLNRIMDYLKDKLSNKERYALEKEINKDPILLDCMDGFSRLSAEELEVDMTQLQERLLKRGSSKKKKYKLLPLLPWAAGLALLLGLISIFHLLLPPDTPQPMEDAIAYHVQEKETQDEIMPTLVAPPAVGDKAVQQQFSPPPPPPSVCEDIILVDEDIEDYDLIEEVEDPIIAMPEEEAVLASNKKEKVLENQQLLEESKMVSEHTALSKQKPLTSVHETSDERTIDPLLESEVSKCDESDTSLGYAVNKQYTKEKNIPHVVVTYQPNYKQNAKPTEGIRKFKKKLREYLLQSSHQQLKIQFWVKDNGQLENIEIIERGNKIYPTELIQLLMDTEPWSPAINNKEKTKQLISVDFK